MDKYKFFGQGYRELGYSNPKIAKDFHRNNYYDIEGILKKFKIINKKKNVYSSIYSYSEKPIESSKVDVATVIFDRLVFDFDVDETDEMIIKYDNPSVNLSTMSSEEIEKKSLDIKALEHTNLSRMSDDEIREHYYEKFLKGYLDKPINEAKKVAEWFERTFDVKPILFFSGGKGAHLVVLLNNPVELKDADAVIHHIFEKIKSELNLATADGSVATSYKNHLIRIPTSMHQKTKMFANQIFVDSSLKEILDCAMSQREFDEIIIPQNDTGNLEDVLVYTDERLQLLKKSNSSNKEINGDTKYQFNSSSPIGEDASLQEMFLKVYKQGQMNTMGYRFIHVCYRADVPKDDVKTFFRELPIEQNIKEVDSWIDRCYGLNIETDVVTGLNHFIEGIKANADVDDVDLLVSYFTGLFTKKDVVKTEKLEKFSIIGTKDKNYDVEATTVNGKYTTIEIKELLDNKNFSFKLDLFQEKAYFIADSYPLKLNYKFDDAEFTLKPKEKLKSHKSKIKSICHIEITDELIESLDLYFTNLYDKITEANAIDKNEQMIKVAHMNPTETTVLRNLSKILKDELCIKKTTDKKHPYYYLETDLTRSNSPSMKQIDENLLGYILEQEHGLTLPLASLKTILSCIHGNHDIDNSKWEFAEGYYLRTDSIYDVKPIPDPIITPKKLGKKVGQKFLFFKYNPKVKLINNSSNETLVESVLKKIFIPKDDQQDTRLYIDFLQRLGASFIQTNVHKTLTMYYGKGDNGKSLLSHLMNVIFTSKFYIGITPKELRDDLFNDARSSGKHITTIDELDRESFKKIQAILKRRSSGISNQSVREMNTTNSDELATYGMIYMFTNIIPDVDTTDKQFLERLDILELPNQFKSHPKEDKNQYQKERFIEEKINNDFEGLEWLVNASIQAYKNVKYDFMCKQSKKETLDIVLDKNDLKKYLMLYTETTVGSSIGTAELSDGFKDYADKNSITINMTDKQLAKNIGIELSSIYTKDELGKAKQPNKATEYSLRLLSSDEVDKKNKSTEYCITEYKIDWESCLKGDVKVIYQWIKEGSKTTFDELCGEREVDVVKEAINSLEKIGYIEEKLDD